MRIGLKVVGLRRWGEADVVDVVGMTITVEIGR
jgi:hypothetical protein